MEKGKVNSYVRRLLAQRTNKSLEDLTLAETIYLFTDSSPQHKINEKMWRFQQQANRLARRSKDLDFFQHFERYKDPYGFTRWRINPELDEETQSKAADEFRQRLFRDSFRRRLKKSQTGSTNAFSKYCRDTYKDPNITLESTVESHLKYHKGKGDCVGMTAYYLAMSEWFNIPMQTGTFNEHIFPIDPNNKPFEISRWEGINFHRGLCKSSCYYGLVPVVDGSYNTIISSVLHNRHMEHEGKGRETLARKYLEQSSRVCKIAPEPITSNIADAVHKKDFRKAAYWLGKLKQTVPQFPGFYLLFEARIEEGKGNLEKAIEFMEKASACNHHREDDYMAELADFYERTKNFKKAIHWYERAIRRAKQIKIPRKFNDHYNLSSCYSEIEDYKNAHKHINFAIKKAEDADERHRAYYMKGLHYWEVDRYHLAAHWIRKAIKEEALEGKTLSKRPLKYLWDCAKHIADKPKKKRIKSYVKYHADPKQFERLKKEQAA